MNNTALYTIFTHQSVRNFTNEKLSDSEVNNIKRAVIQSSSSCFFQIVSVVRVTEPALLEKLAHFSGDQEHIAKCAEFWMFCIDFTKLKATQDLNDELSFKLFYSGLTDCSIACENALVAAEAQGLGGTIIGGYKKDIKEVSELLRLPKYVFPAIGLVLGHVDEEYLEQQKPRLPDNYLFMDNYYQNAYEKDTMDHYDKKMTEYYENRKYNKRSVSWTKACAAMLDKEETGDNIIKFIKEKGFHI